MTNHPNKSQDVRNKYTENQGQDLKKAFELFNKAYALNDNYNNNKIMKYIGWYYENGQCVERNYDIALDYYIKAYQIDSVTGLHDIIMLYSSKPVDVHSETVTKYLVEFYVKFGPSLELVNIYGKRNNLDTAIAYCLELINSYKDYLRESFSNVPFHMKQQKNYDQAKKLLAELYIKQEQLNKDKEKKIYELEEKLKIYESKT